MVYSVLAMLLGCRTLEITPVYSWQSDSIEELQDSGECDGEGDFVDELAGDLLSDAFVWLAFEAIPSALSKLVSIVR
jgi:hypothetical protein